MFLGSQNSEPAGRDLRDHSIVYIRKQRRRSINYRDPTPNSNSRILSFILSILLPIRSFSGRSFLFILELSVENFYYLSTLSSSAIYMCIDKIKRWHTLLSQKKDCQWIKINKSERLHSKRNTQSTLLQGTTLFKE